MSLHVECKIRRPVSKDNPLGGSLVELARTIHFKPIDPTREDSPHVAEVTDGEAAILFAADARVYVPFTSPPVEAKLAVPGTAPPSAPPPATSFEAAQAAGAGQAAETKAPADTNGDGTVSVRELRTRANAGALGVDEAKALLAAETAGAGRKEIVRICQRVIDDAAEGSA